MRSTVLARAAGALAVGAAVGLAVYPLLSVDADEASCSVTPSSYADAVLNPPKGEDTDFFVNTGGIPSLMLLVDTSRSMLRLPPDGASLSWGSFEGAATSFGCDNDVGNTVAFHSSCGLTTLEGQPFNPPLDGLDDPPVWAEAKDASGRYCPYMVSGNQPMGRDKPGYDPDFYPALFSADRVYHDTIASSASGAIDGWGDFSGNPTADASVPGFCGRASWSAAQQTSCTSCMKERGYWFDGSYVAWTGPSCAKTADCQERGLGHLHQGRDRRRARRQQRQQRALPRTERLVQRELPQLLSAEVRGGTEGPEGRRRGGPQAPARAHHPERRRRRAPPRATDPDLRQGRRAVLVGREPDRHHERDQQRQGQVHERARAARRGAPRRGAALRDEIEPVVQLDVRQQRLHGRRGEQEEPVRLLLLPGHRGAHDLRRAAHDRRDHPRPGVRGLAHDARRREHDRQLRRYGRLQHHRDLRRRLPGVQHGRRGRGHDPRRRRVPRPAAVGCLREHGQSVPHPLVPPQGRLVPPQHGLPRRQRDGARRFQEQGKAEHHDLHHRPRDAGQHLARARAHRHRRRRVLQRRQRLRRHRREDAPRGHPARDGGREHPLHLVRRRLALHPPGVRQPGRARTALRAVALGALERAPLRVRPVQRVHRRRPGLPHPHERRERPGERRLRLRRALHERVPEGRGRRLHPGGRDRRFQEEQPQEPRRVRLRQPLHVVRHGVEHRREASLGRGRQAVSADGHDRSAHRRPDDDPEDGRLQGLGRAERLHRHGLGQRR